mmetsp:Transcript_8368/g.12199  ORF Transcript_8368/g.12199 Transcript_8368/m.12199 type:complete len:425 (+) Transcript_8368:38-1312(+)
MCRLNAKYFICEDMLSSNKYFYSISKSSIRPFILRPTLPTSLLLLFSFCGRGISCRRSITCFDSFLPILERHRMVFTRSSSIAKTSHLKSDEDFSGTYPNVVTPGPTGMPKKTTASTKRRKQLSHQDELALRDSNDNGSKPDFSAFQYTGPSFSEKPNLDHDKASINESFSTPLKNIASSNKKRRSDDTNTNASPQKKKEQSPLLIEQPKDWEAIYSLVQELRADKTAPVDISGASSIIEKDLGEKVYRFQVLIALMLSSQTKDAVVGETMRGLQKHGLTVESIRSTSHDKLNELIYKVGFRNNKTKYIKSVCEILATEYEGDIPTTAEEMIQKLPGVGPKMAYIVESIAFGITTGIGVDTHMHRLFNQLNWVKNTNSPEKTRLQLQGWLPEEKWDEINVLWVGFGQETQQQKEFFFTESNWLQ